MRTCRDLNKEIQTNSSKVKDALKLSQQDQNVVGQLKTEIDAAWKSSDQAQDKDCRARETVQSLKQGDHLLYFVSWLIIIFFLSQ